jgi:hypothetical protein
MILALMAILDNQIISLFCRAIYFIPMCTISLQYIKEQKNGLKNRSTVAGMKTFEVWFSACVMETLLSLLKLGICLPIVFFGCNVEPKESIGLAVILIILMSLAGVSMGKILFVIKFIVF